MVQAMKSLQELQKSHAAKTLGWGQEMVLTQEGVGLLSVQTRSEKILTEQRFGC